MFHACDQRFDVMENLENFCELNKARYGKVYFTLGMCSHFHTHEFALRVYKHIS